MSGLYGPPISLGAIYGIRNARAIFLGDSLTGVGGNGAFGETWPVYACIVSGQRLRMQNLAGVAGERTDQMLLRLQADVIANAPGVCVIMAGTNDIGQVVAAATAMANINTMVSRLRAAGIEPILCTIPPRDTVGSSGTLAQVRTNVADYNRRLKLYAMKNGVALFDAYAVLVDPATGGYLAGQTSDGVHLNTAGMLTLANGIQSSITNLFPPSVPPLVTSVADTNILLNGTMVDGNADSVPDSWTTLQAGGGTAVYTVTTDANIAGSVASIQKTDANAGGYVSLYQYVAMSGKAAIGDRIAFACKYNLSGGAYGVISVALLDSGFVNPTTIFVMASASQVLSAPGTIYAEIVVPATVGGTANAPAQLQVKISAYQAAGTLKVGQVTLTNLTQLGF